MKSTAAEIEAALTKWRSINATRNKEHLKIYVDAISNVVDEEFDEEEMANIRLESLASLLVTSSDSLAADGITTPADFLERFDELAPKYRLDGTEGGDFTPQERADISNSEFAELVRVLRERAPEGSVRDTITVPEEFTVLARHVLGIVDPDLPNSQSVIGSSLWAGTPVSDIASRVHKPADIPVWGADLLMGADVDLEFAVGWCSGWCRDGEFVCVYSREVDGDEWAWRFVWVEIGDTQVFETIPELFTWYQEYMLGSELPDLTGVEDGSILQGMWEGI
ncbi:unnamed protein product [Discula destructiva]